MNSADKSSLVALHTSGIGPMAWQSLLQTYPSAGELLMASENELANIIGAKLAHSFKENQQNIDFEKLEKEYFDQGISFLSQFSPQYPKSLLNISDSPIGLFVKGDVGLLDMSNRHYIAVVGTRKTTNYGIGAVSKIVGELGNLPIVIVSGMALGIDTVAHMSALKNNLKTIAVLGCGINIIYPKENISIYNEILAKGGAIISEFLPNQTVVKGLFVSRNRIISGLCEGICIIEGEIKSGSMITAKYALDQGKDVFAVPGLITNLYSSGPNELLRSGAIPLISGTDILDHIGITIRSKSQESNTNLEGKEKVIFDLLKIQDMSMDEMSKRTAWGIVDVSTILTNLEILGIAKTSGNGMYSLL